MLSLFFVAFGFSQDAIDGLNYSLDDFGGTARFKAMSGAFGALGGDLSAINVNPAGSAVFINNQFGVTLSTYTNRNNNKYFGESRSTTETFSDLNQAGAVFVFKNPDAVMKKFSIALNFENNPTFRNNHLTQGVNPNQSLASYFLNFANGGRLSTYTQPSASNITRFDDLQGWLGYGGFMINPVNANDPNNTAYVSNVVENNLNHSNVISNSGQNGKFTFNFASQIKDRLFIGANINLHYSEQNRLQTFRESHDNLTNPNQNLRSTVFNYDLFSQSNGFSLQIGSIYKVTPDLRAGLSYESPTWMNVQEILNQSISSRYVDHTNGNSLESSSRNTGDVILPEYSIQTPGRIGASLAYLFSDKGILSFDYGYKDFSQMRFSGSNTDYTVLNNSIKNIFTVSHDVRVGGEYKYKKLSVRGGYRWQSSPYENTAIMGDLTSYSGGLGYNFGNTKVDFAVATMSRTSQNKFFQADSINAYSLSNRLNTYALTVLFEL